jgi:hypothetical protein
MSIDQLLTKDSKTVFSYRNTAGAFDPDEWRRKYVGLGVSPTASNELTKGAFDPDEIKVLVTAFEEALQELHLVNRNDAAATLIAKRIMALAQQGECDPNHLRDEAIRIYRAWLSLFD